MFPTAFELPAWRAVCNRWILRAVLIFFTGTVAVVHADTQSVWLSWEETPSDDAIVGYHVFYGTQSGIYTNAIAVNYYTGAEVSGLQAGQTYYFAVSGMDTNGISSPLSAEVSYAVPVPEQVMLQTEVYTDDSGAAYAMGVFGSWDTLTDWELDYSTNLVDWSPWQTGHGNGFWTYVEFDSASQMYFRLANH